MKNKSKKLILVSIILFLIMFNLIFFILGGVNHNISVWIAYGFIHLSGIVLIISAFIPTKNNQLSALRLSNISLTLCYFGLEFIIGIVFILISTEKFKLELVIQIVIFFIYLILFVINKSKDAEIEGYFNQRNKNIKFIDNLCLNLNNIKLYVKDINLLKQIEYSYDLIHSSPINSNESVSQIENKLTELLDKILNDCENEKLENLSEDLRKLNNLVNQRNDMLKKNIE